MYFEGRKSCHAKSGRRVATCAYDNTEMIQYTHFYVRMYAVTCSRDEVSVPCSLPFPNYVRVVRFISESEILFASKYSLICKGGT